jgi:hypothetical protein
MLTYELAETPKSGFSLKGHSVEESCVASMAVHRDLPAALTAQDDEAGASMATFGELIRQVAG